MIAAAESTYGKLDILFNNAGISHADDDDAINTTEAVWDQTMAVNVKGVFLGCKYGIPALQRAGGGSIINTASFVAVLGRGHTAVGLHGQQGRGPGDDARAGGDSRAGEYPRQRALPGSAAHRAADEIPRYRRKESGGGWCIFRWGALARRLRSPMRSCSWLRTNPPLSRAAPSWSMAASPLLTSRLNSDAAGHSTYGPRVSADRCSR